MIRTTCPYSSASALQPLLAQIWREEKMPDNWLEGVLVIAAKTFILTELRIQDQRMPFLFGLEFALTIKKSVFRQDLSTPYCSSCCSLTTAKIVCCHLTRLNLIELTS